MRNLAIATLLAMGGTLFLQRPAPPAPVRVVCESGEFSDIEPTRADPYIRQRAICAFQDANGEPVEVVIID